MNGTYTGAFSSLYSGLAYVLARCMPRQTLRGLDRNLKPETDTGASTCAQRESLHSVLLNQDGRFSAETLWYSSIARRLKAGTALKQLTHV